jgi:outer membrane protein
VSFTLRAARLFLSSILCLPLAAQAQSNPLGDVMKDGGAGEGGVVRIESSIYSGQGMRTDYLPVNLYFGEHAYWHADRVGLKWRLDPNSRIDVFLAHRYEGTTQDDIPPVLAGMAIREQGTDLGVGYRRRFGWGEVFGEALHNVDGDSQGSELRLGFRKEHAYGRLRYSPQIMVSWRDGKLNNYYYGVLPGEATAARPAYDAGAGLNLQFSVYATYPLGTHWKVLAGASATQWSSTVRHSPIVESGMQSSVSLGLLYDHSPQPWPIPEGRPLWVKLYHGQQTDCDLAKVMLFRCTSTDTPEETRVSAVELGRTLIERFNGWNMDIAGYIGLLYHDEKGYQPNSWQLNAYFKPYWYGLPWNHRVKTRLGIGTGLSYAGRVPYIEAKDQAERGRNTSKLLTYLDPTIDFSVGDLFNVRRLKDTFVGIGASHRSGIFGFSQLLNNVNGGSNYIYTYVEFAL